MICYICKKPTKHRICLCCDDRSHAKQTIDGFGLSKEGKWPIESYSLPDDLIADFHVNWENELYEGL